MQGGNNSGHLDEFPMEDLDVGEAECRNIEGNNDQG